MSTISTFSRLSGTTTENGTPIVSGSEISKDMFLKILAAEIQNQDPFSEQDPTAYVTQLAQFAQMEQAINTTTIIEDLISINNGMLINSAMSTASGLIGKNVEVANSSGLGETLSGVVQSAYVEDSVVYLEVKLDDTGEVKSFSYGDLLKVSLNKSENNSTSNGTVVEDKNNNTTEEV